MKSANTFKIDSEIFENQQVKNQLRNQINSFYLEIRQINSFIETPVNLRSSIFILVLNGTGRLQVNFKEYILNSKHKVLLSFGHFFMFREVTPDFRCMCLYINKEFMDEMYSTEMIYKRVKYNVKMYSRPILLLNEENSDLLYRRMKFTNSMIDLVDHIYHKEMILNSLTIFFLDLGNIIEKDRSIPQKANLSRDEIMIQKFLELLADHYKAEHNVDFYARQLHITPHYLTLIVKRMTGQTVSDFIFQMLYNEGKMLLKELRFSIQQIADDLNFSDQSSFGKFFKRKSGLSPNQFRKNMTI